MDVSDEFHEVRIFFTDNGFVSVLEKVATPFMAFVKGNGIAGHEAAHDFAERGRAGSQQKMKMIWNQ